MDIRSLYRHEHISPELLMKRLFHLKETESAQTSLFSINEMFGNALERDELEKVPSFYKQPDGWSNRLVQGDSLMVMTSLLEREGMAGKIQMIYIDPPYGIKYGGNWQIKLNNRDVKDGKDEHLSGEPEQIKAYRDTWELGIHSYLSYMRDRLLVAKELLTESGSCFVQISDENVHLVRCLMDEVFGSGNFVSVISYVTTSGFDTSTLARTGDYILWYSKNKKEIKYRQLFEEKDTSVEGGKYRWLMFPDGSYRGVTAREIRKEESLPEGVRLYQPTSLISQGSTKSLQDFEYKGKIYNSGNGNHWKTSIEGLNRLGEKNRIHVAKNSIRFVRYADDFPVKPINNLWTDTATGNFTDNKVFVVQTASKVIQRCLLMCTDPGDLILDPTCGSGTTAYVAEQWGRRWITIDTSRIAINIAKTRLATATFPFYELYDQDGEDIKQGFIYKKVPHITLKALANDEPFAEETLYDQPKIDRKKIRVASAFTVETLQSFEPIPPEELDKNDPKVNEIENF